MANQYFPDTIRGVVVPDDANVKIGTSAKPISDIQARTLTASSTITASAVAATTVTATGAVTGSGFVQTVSGLTTTGSVRLYSNFKAGGTPWFQPDGTNTKDIMDSFTLPANTLTTGRALRFRVYGVHTGNNTNVCTVAITVGGTIGAYQTTLADGTDIATFNAIIATTPFQLKADLNQFEASVQRSYNRFNGGATAEILPTDVSLTQDFTADKTFILTLKNVTAATDASIYGWTVELV